MIRETEYIEQIKTFHGCIPNIMRTRMEFIACGVENVVVRKVWETFCNEIENADCLLNRFSPDSEVAKINASVPMNNMPVSFELADILRLCDEYYYLTDGLFDITCGHANLYEFNEDGLLTLRKGYLDFGGFAKGYVIKRFKRQLEKSGVENAFINFGNSTIVGLGKHPCGDSWNVDVMNPYTREKVTTEHLRNVALSTSGNTPWSDAHIINTRTGKPVIGKKMACVTASDPLDAEVLSTVAMVAEAQELEMLRMKFPQTKISIYE